MANEFQVHILNDAGIQKAKMLGAAFDLIVANLDVIGIGTEAEVVRFEQERRAVAS